MECNFAFSPCTATMDLMDILLLSCSFLLCLYVIVGEMLDYESV